MTFIPSLDRHLATLETALKAANMWSEISPSTKALASTTPFCVDTLAFEEWCQWVFIPQLRQLLKNPNFNGLPSKCDTATMADFVFSQRNLNHQDIKHIIAALKQIDAHLNTQLPTKH